MCQIDDHRVTPPTAAAQQSLVRVLAWSRWRNRLPNDVDATTTFVSRSSNNHPAGTTVTTPAIAGHRDDTFTTCPGDAAYALLPAWRRAVAALPDPSFPDDREYRRAERLGVTDFGEPNRARGASGP